MLPQALRPAAWAATAPRRARWGLLASAAQRRAHAQAAAGSQAAAGGERRQPPPALSLVAATPTATQLLAAFFACELRPADCYLLHGSVGAGKSYFRWGPGAKAGC